MKKEDVFVIGFPRSGNTWVARLLGDVLDSPVKARNNNLSIGDEGFQRPGKYTIRQEHTEPDNFSKEDKIVLVVRDPRDVFVSAMHYWGIKDIETAAHCVVYGKWPTPQGSGWTHFYHKWMRSFDKVSFVACYEELKEDTEGELRWMLDYLNVSPINDPAEVVQRQAFEARKKYAKQHRRELPYGFEIQNRALRKGIVGDWLNYFGEELINKIREANPHGINFCETAKEMGYDVCSY